MSKDICRGYELLLEKKFVSFPLANDSKSKIESFVSSINSVYFGKEIYLSNEEKTVAYLYFIIKSHAFVDGNKRVGCLSFLVLCDLNKIKPSFEKFTLDELAVYLEQSKRKDYQKLIWEVAEFLFP